MKRKEKFSSHLHQFNVDNFVHLNMYHHLNLITNLITTFSQSDLIKDQPSSNIVNNLESQEGS